MKLGQSKLRAVRQTPTTPTESAAVHLARRIEMPTAFGWHSHRPLQWFGAGIGVVVLDTEEGQWIALPGQALIVGSHVSHLVSCYGAPFVDTVYLEPDAVPFEPGETCRSMEVSALLAAAVGALMGEQHPYPIGSDCRCSLLTRLILDEMLRNQRALFGLPSPTSRSLRILCAHIREEPADLRDIDGWANSIGVSRRTLTRRLRNETGLSFVEWRQRARVICALKLEAQGAASKQIADATGYASVQTLRAEIRKAVGGSLKTFRR